MNDKVLRHLMQAVDVPDMRGTVYEVREELGRGGMGTVYRAWDANLQREVALKVTEGSDAAESRIAASLEHPGIVPVYDAGRLPDGRIFHVMRLVRGRPLHEYVNARTPLSERIAIFQKTCEAVAFAHSNGVVHCDLKPSNIMVGPFGDVSILDWGAAGRIGEQKPTRTGTPGFLAPERARGAAPSAASDMYSLGALWRSLLPADPPKPLAAVAARAMHADPAHRYSTALALSRDLGHYLDGFRVEAYQESPVERGLRFVQRNRILFLLFAAYLLTRIAVFIFSRR
jgi:serine/threonine protein kinase